MPFDTSTKFVPAGLAMARVAAISADTAIAELKADIEARETALQSPTLSLFMRNKHLAHLKVLHAELARWDRD